MSARGSMKLRAFEIGLDVLAIWADKNPDRLVALCREVRNGIGVFRREFTAAQRADDREMARAERARVAAVELERKAVRK